MNEHTDHLLTAEKEMIVGGHLMLKGDYEESERFFISAINKLRVYRTSNIMFTLSLDGLGQLYLLQDNLDKAKEMFEEVLELYENYFPEYVIGIFLILVNLSAVLENQDHIEESEEKLKEAKELIRSFYDEGHKKLIEVFVENYERVLKKSGKTKEAKKIKKEIMGSLS